MSKTTQIRKNNMPNNNKNNVFTRWNDKRRIGTHQVAIIPRYLPLHHGDCPCRLGWSHLITKQQWRALKAHPMPKISSPE